MKRIKQIQEIINKNEEETFKITLLTQQENDDVKVTHLPTVYKCKDIIKQETDGEYITQYQLVNQEDNSQVNYDKKSLIEMLITNNKTGDVLVFSKKK